MRLLQLATTTGEVLDLHPNVSVVVGLSDADRDLLVSTVTRLCRAEAVDAEGLLEAHGVLFDLDPALLDLIEGAPPDVDPIVKAGQLPAQPVSLDVRELRAREEAFAVLLELVRAQTDKRSAARDTLSAATEALERAHAARAEAIEHNDRRTMGAEAVATELERLADERRRVRNDLEDARLGLAEARSVIAASERAAEPIFEPITIEPPDDRPPAPAEKADAPSAVRSHTVALSAEDAERVTELEQLLHALAPGERRLIEQALALVTGTGDGALAPSPEAQRVADELDWLADQLGSAGTGPLDDAATSSLVEVQQRLDDARQALLEAEQAVRTPELDRDDVLRLEDIHGELIEAIEKSDGRFGKTRAANRVVELRRAEQEVLDRLGFTSYSAYMMGYSLNDTDPAMEDALDRARAELAEAEDAWEALQDVSENELERAAALHQRRELFQRARELLGEEVDEAPQAALRALRVPAVSADDAASVLRGALDTVGVDVGDEELDHEDLVVIAQAWLAEADDVAERRRAIDEELARLRGEAVPGPGPQAEAAPESQAGSGSGAETAPAAVPWPELDAAPDPAPTASAGAANDDLDEWRARIDELEAQVVALEAELTALDVEVAAAELAVDGLGRDLDLPALDRQLEVAKAVHAEAAAAIEMIDKRIVTLDAEGRAEAQEIERLQDIVAEQGTGSATPAEELEWYLLARLAALRSVSIAGSVPLLLADALRGLAVDEACHLLTRLERMADVVQVIVLSDDPVVASWAATTGPARAAVVAPGPR